MSAVFISRETVKDRHSSATAMLAEFLSLTHIEAFCIYVSIASYCALKHFQIVEPIESIIQCMSAKSVLFEQRFLFQCSRYDVHDVLLKT